MVVLGIDPGYAIVGYGGIEFSNNRYRTLGYGAITTTPEQSFDLRLQIIFNRMNDIFEKCKPDVMAVERLYFQNNQKTAIDVAQARGVILLSAKLNNVPIYEYTPLQVKTAVTGYGKAQKEQVMEMTRRLLKLEKVPKPDDTADALAIAICHTQANCSPIKEFLNKRGIRT